MFKIYGKVCSICSYNNTETFPANQKENPCEKSIFFLFEDDQLVVNFAPNVPISISQLFGFSSLPKVMERSLAIRYRLSYF